jgi:hypothetical protein
MTIKRYTVVMLPPEDVANSFIEYVNNKDFDQYAKDLYRLGRKVPGRDNIAKPHITQAQFECTESQFNQVIEFLKKFHAEKKLKSIKVSFGGVNFYPISAGAKMYAPELPYSTCWFDRDVVREPLMELNEELVSFLEGIGIKSTVNGVRGKYRPHFTMFRGVLPDGLDSIAMPKFKGEASFDVHVAVGESELTGEFVNMLGEFKNGVFVDAASKVSIASDFNKNNLFDAPVPVVPGLAAGLGLPKATNVDVDVKQVDKAEFKGKEQHIALPTIN